MEGTYIYLYLKWVDIELKKTTILIKRKHNIVASCYDFILFYRDCQEDIYFPLIKFLLDFLSPKMGIGSY